MKNLLFLILSIVLLGANAQKLVTSTPFELYGDHIFISLSVDDSDPVDFIFDTGDGLAVIDLDLAEALDLKMDEKSTKTSAQGTITGALIEHNKVEINNVKIDDIELYTTSLDHLERTIGRNIDGIIGYDLLQNYVVKIDYEDMTLKLYTQDDFDYSGYGQEFSFKLVNYIPCIGASVTLNSGETFDEEFYLNTGAGTTLDFNTPFASKNDVINKTGEHYSYPVSGLGKEETMHYEGRVRTFRLGTFTIDNLPIGISQAEHGIQNSKKAAGIIGNGLLRRFNMTLDYKNKKVYLEANKYNEDPFRVNASGLNLQYGDEMNKLLVHRVYEGSPAYTAGMKEDAVILKVNGKDVSEYTLPEIKKLLEKANTKVKLTYYQDAIEQEAELDLEPLI